MRRNGFLQHGFIDQRAGTAVRLFSLGAPARRIPTDAENECSALWLEGGLTTTPSADGEGSCAVVAEVVAPGGRK